MLLLFTYIYSIHAIKYNASGNISNLSTGITFYSKIWLSIAVLDTYLLHVILKTLLT